MRQLIIFIIRFYQRFISPYKGFRCAHAALHKGDSCSEAIKRIVREHGLIHGYRLTRLRLLACGDAYKTLKVMQEGKRKPSKKRDNRKDQRWYDNCDPGCACNAFECLPKGKGCDLPDLPCDCSFF